MAKVLIGNVFPSDEHLLERCAPAGHGLGDVSNSAKHSATPDNIDTLFAAGWYQYYDKTYKSLAKLGFSGGLLVVPTFEGAVQIFYPRFQNKVMPGTYGIRKCEEGIWSEWYIQNPVMNVGIEYLTTERFMGKPVYTKLLDFGESADGASIAHELNPNPIVRYSAVAGAIPLPHLNTVEPDYQITVSVGATNITMACGKNRTGLQTYVQLWYIKD